MIKHALITGAGTGIGASIAATLATAGFSITLLGRRQDVLESAAAKLDTATENSQCIVCDVGSESRVKQAFTQARSGLGDIQILVNCAGIAPTSPFHKLSGKQWNEVLNVNLNGVFYCTAAVIEQMRQNRYGRIINIASTASLRGYAYVSAYTAAKHGVLGLTRALALETAPLGITVNAVCPGYTDTEIIAQAVTNIMKATGQSRQQAMANFTSTNPQGRLIDPEEVAATVLWLCSDSARSVNGQAISVCGGETNF
ncbi:MAG TPA: SDR family oxidoreductase [Gammaproteobacteria bacterium]|nr:SDR family oxidoreductase [Gammaproteobacteria bacterium]